MPTYNARGVTATLHVARLQETLSTQPELMKRTDNAHHAKHVGEVIATGDRLYERPIGPDGSEKGGARFIGEFEDLPFFMVETGEHIAHVSERISARSIESPPPRTPLPDLMNVDAVMSEASSPLTSLGQTPSLGSPENSFLQEPQEEQIAELSRHDSVLEHPPEEKEKEQAPSAPVLQRLLQSFPAKKYRREPLTEAQAMSLDLEIGCKARGSKEDVKMEVFFNGTLVGTDFINTKRFTLTHEGQLYTTNFHGTRLHVQIEKPWIYRGADQASQSPLSAEERWAAVAELLVLEAKSRGHDAKGLPAPSAEYLNALSTVTIADRLKDNPQISIIDMVVTTGEGKKFSSNHPFVIEPLRLSSARHGKQVECSEQVDPPSDDAVQLQDELMRDGGGDEVQAVEEPTVETESSDLAPIIPSTSPEVPLARRARRFQAPRQKEERKVATPPTQDLPPIVEEEPKVLFPPEQETPPVAEEKGITPVKKRTAHQEKIDALANELGLTPHKAKLVTNFKNRRGKAGTPRSVTERLSDILKMNPENQGKAKQDLLLQLSEGGALFTKTAPTGQSKTASTGGSGFSPVKKPKTDTGASSLAITRQREETPAQSLPNAADVPMPDVDDDPVAALAQARMDTALDFGAPPNGRLAQRIESLSPHRTPVKRLGGSSWGSPGGENIAPEGDSQEHSSRNVSASPTKLRRGRSKLVADASGAPEQTPKVEQELGTQVAEAATASKAQSAALGGKKKAADPAHLYGCTPEEAMAAFEIPKVCQGASITYADPGQHRTVVKLRPGEFNEQRLVVGMRFVVL